jgi:exodeoxyribonuclease V alpha subunit
MDHNEQLQGTVERIVYQNAENGFTIFIIKSNRDTEVTVKGSVPTLNPGEQVTLSGAWTMHPKFGKQFEAKKCTALVPTSILGLKKYLGSGLIKGIGPVFAEKLVKQFGESVLEVIEKEPHRLNAIPGVGPKRIESIKLAWQEQKEISHIMVFLQDKGISTTYATKIYKRYRNQAIELLLENPYRLAEDIWGIGFKTADTIAQNMGFEPESLKRIRAGLLFMLGNTVSQGHLYAELVDLKEKTLTLLELESNDDIQNKLKLALHDLYNTEKIKLLTHDEKHYVALSQYYYSEKGVATKIRKLIESSSLHHFDIDAIYQTLRVEIPGEINLNEEQQKGVLTILQNKVTVITGGPGTGKTTLIKKLLSILDEQKITYKLASPTGRAAKRITESTGKKATTLHRLLEFDVSTMGFTRNEQNALPLDILIVDEASMIDIFLAHAVLKAIPHHARIVFIGDVDQLPSVGAGNFLNDLFASKAVATIRLMQIFRQAQDSMIIINAHRINQGEFPISQLPNTRRDFIYIKEDNPENVPNLLRQIFTKDLYKYDINPRDGVVLVPMHRGTVGTQKINYDLQNILNPATTEKQMQYAGTTYKVGDRVMQIKNNYDKFVFNGDIGFIEDIDTTDRIMAVRYPEQRVEYEYSDLDELVLAYAISIHKSQGSEYDAVVIPIFTQHFTLLQRNLIYTAITRAKKLCIFLGQAKAIAMGIKNNKGLVRTTFLQQFLTSDLAAR